MFEFNKISWSLWLVTVVFLSAGLYGIVEGFYAAITLTVLHAGLSLNRERKLTAFPVQVRVAYLGLLLLGLVPYMGLIYWIPAVGTWAMLLTGYCPMARIMSLMPWNRNSWPSLADIHTTVFSAPIKGSVKNVFEAARRI